MQTIVEDMNLSQGFNNKANRVHEVRTIQKSQITQ